MPGLVTVESYTSPWDAHVACGLLESEGIPASVAGEHHVWANWPISQALGGVRIQVPQEHVAKAKEVLAQQLAFEFLDPLLVLPRGLRAGTSLLGLG